MVGLGRGVRSPAAPGQGLAVSPKVRLGPVSCEGCFLTGQQRCYEGVVRRQGLVRGEGVGEGGVRGRGGRGGILDNLEAGGLTGGVLDGLEAKG